MNKQTIVVNIFGGPGSGKSMLAAQIFHKLKWERIDCEMTREYAKTLVWSESFNSLEDQLYVFAKQNHKLYTLNGKVDVVITDAPLVNSILYDIQKDETLENLIVKKHEDYINLNFFLERNDKNFIEDGRYHNLEESKQLDTTIQNILYKHNLPYKIIKCNNIDIEDLYDDILVKLKTAQE